MAGFPGIVSLWFLPIAIFKWTMFHTHFIRKEWDGSSYSYEVQFIARIWSPTYWLRIMVLFFVLKLDYVMTVACVKSEVNILAAPKRARFGYIPLSIPKPIRYLYLFTTLYVV